jgi:hypothetical protein
MRDLIDARGGSGLVRVLVMMVLTVLVKGHAATDAVASVRRSSAGAVQCTARVEFFVLVDARSGLVDAKQWVSAAPPLSLGWKGKAGPGKQIMPPQSGRLPPETWTMQPPRDRILI